MGLDDLEPVERIDDHPRTPVRPRSRRSGREAPPGQPGRPAVEQLSRLFPVVVLVGIAWSIAWETDGSIAAKDWLPYALFGSLVLAGALLAAGRVRPNRLCSAALATLGAYAAFVALSIVWAPIQSLARDEALLVLLYTMTLAVALLTLRTADDRLYAGGAVALGAATMTLAAAVKLRTAADPTDFFFGGRLDFPVTYINAQAGATLVGFWPAVVVAARRTAPVWVRSLAVGAATTLLCGWLATQSKGGALGVVVSAAVVFAVSDARLRLAVPAGLAAVVTAIGASPLTSPIRASGHEALASAIRHTGSMLLVLTVVGCLAGAGYALADHRVRVPQHVRATASAVARIGVLIAVVGLLALVVARNPARLWSQFEHQPTTSSGSTHLLSLGSNRSDFWRVALEEFVHHPLGGIGARGFATAYLQHRRSPESPARAHSLEADALSETGVVGFALLVGALGLLLFAAVRRARIEAAAAGALGGAVCLLAQASVDWTWTFPAVGMPLFVLLGAGASSGRRRTARLSLPTAIAVAAGVAVIGVVAFAPPWLAARYNDRAAQGGSDALADVSRAKQLDPLSVDPYITESQLAPTAKAAVPPLQAAVRKEPQSYAMHYLLAFGYYRAGLVGSARRELVLAHRLDPGDPIVASALARLPKNS